MASIVELPRLPLTSSGKLDRRALPAVTNNDAPADAGSLPRTPTEKQIMEVFAAVLASYYDPGPGVAALPKEEVVAQARLTVPLLMGGLQGLMSWWLEHPEVPRAKVEAKAVDVGWLGLDRIRRGEWLPLDSD